VIEGRWKYLEHDWIEMWRRSCADAGLGAA